MARIRSIHPGLSTDEAFMAMTPLAKAAWMLLWTECDDHGVFEWKPLVLKARILPADAVDFDQLLAEWEGLGCIQRFSDDGRAFGAVRNFCKFQKPKKPAYRHPFPESIRTYVRLKAIGTEPVPHPAPTEGEETRQMEVGGGSREEEKGTTAQHSEPREKLGGVPIVLWRGERTAIWFDQLETECREAAGLENDPSPALRNPSPIVTLIDKGYDFVRDILPVLRAFKAKGKAGKTWDYYVSAITEGKARNDKIEPKAVASPVAETVWLTEDDPLYLEARANLERETGRRAFAAGSRNRTGIGFEFPFNCVPRKDEQEAA